MTGGSTTPAGWYPSEDPTRQRYWDGDDWTDHYHPPKEAAPPPAPATPVVPTPVVTAPVAASPPPVVLTPDPGPSILPPPGGVGVGIPSVTNPATSVPTELGQGGLIAGIILTVWAGVAFIETIAEFFEARIGEFGVGNFFDGPHSGSAGLLGRFDEWWFDSPLGGEFGRDTNIFQVIVLATAVVALVGVIKSSHDFVRVAAFLAVGQIALFAIIWVPILDDFFSWGDFFTSFVQAAVLPGAALAVFLAGGSKT